MIILFYYAIQFYNLSPFELMVYKDYKTCIVNIDLQVYKPTYSLKGSKHDWFQD